MNSLIVPPVARVVLPCSVNETLRSAGQFKGGVSRTPGLSRRMQRGLRAPAARVRWPGPLGMYVGWMVRRDAVLVVAEGERPQPRPTLSRHHRVKRSAPFIWPSLIASSLSRPLVERRVGALTLDTLVVSAQKKGPGLLKHGAL